MDLKIVNKSDSEAEIFIDDVIGWDETSWLGIKKQLTAIAESKTKKIIVNINSPGGFVSDGLMIHDALKMSKAEIETRVYSMTASAATIIAQAGDKRKMSSNSLYLIHHAMNMAVGNVNDVKQAVDDLERVDERILDIYVKAGADPEKVKSLMDENNGYGKWIDAEEALEIGLIDEIFEPSKAAAIVLPTNEFIAKYKLPEIPKEYLSKINKMEEVKEVEKSILDKIEDLFTRMFKKEEKENEAEVPEDNQPEAEPEAIALNDVQDKEILSAKDNEIAELKSKLEAKETELTNTRTDLASAYTKLGQLDAASTIVEGSQGKEDGDAEPVSVPFGEDLAKLSKVLNRPSPTKRVKDPEKE
jgi:ATP-dependent Clp endopeptidase proteolytic subunit ClpP